MCLDYCRCDDSFVVSLFVFASSGSKLKIGKTSLMPYA